MGEYTLTTQGRIMVDRRVNITWTEEQQEQLERVGRMLEEDGFVYKRDDEYDRSAIIRHLLAQADKQARRTLKK